MTNDENSSATKGYPCSTCTTKASPCHLYAQQLNNSAALCIEIGHYSRAIVSLQKALELNRSQKKGWKDRGQEVCKCYQCTLDACISFSETTPSEAITALNESTHSNKKRRKVSLSSKKDSAFWKPPTSAQHQRAVSQDYNIVDKDNDTTTKFCKNISRSPRPQVDEEFQDDNVVADNHDGGYIYRRPIRISREGHAMGMTLYLIITFNLALAHHLKTISCSMDNKDGRSRNVNRTLVLYELTYKWQLKLLCARDKKNYVNVLTSKRKEGSFLSSPSTPSCTAVTSIRFNMMIRNNLSQIHRLVGNHAKHKRCLEHLLSTVMVVTEYKSRTTMNRVLSNNTKDPRHMELDGFLQNTTSLILRQGHCANAA